MCRFVFSGRAARGFTRWADAAEMNGVVQFGHGVQYDALGLHHSTLQQTELLLLQLVGQLSFTTGLIQHNNSSDPECEEIHQSSTPRSWALCGTCCCNWACRCPSSMLLLCLSCSRELWWSWACCLREFSSASCSLFERSNISLSACRPANVLLSWVPLCGSKHEWMHLFSHKRACKGL